jgi:hypothetical protein
MSLLLTMVVANPPHEENHQELWSKEVNLCFMKPKGEHICFGHNDKFDWSQDIAFWNFTKGLIMLKNVRQKYDIRPLIVTNINGDHLQNFNHNLPLFIFNAIVAMSLRQFVMHFYWMRFYFIFEFFVVLLFLWFQ